MDYLESRFTSAESLAMFKEHIAERMELAKVGRLPWDLVVQMKIAPDVLELKLPDWTYSEGKMHTRLYFSEPADLPMNLVLLRILTKRPGVIGLTEQDQAASEASSLLLEFQERDFC